MGGGVKMGRLLHVIEDADMRCRQEGLIAQAKANKVDMASLKPGDIVAFLNTKKDRLMVMTMLQEEDSHGFLGYYRSPHGRVPPEALEFIPRALGVDGFQMNKAIRAGLAKLLAKRGHKVEGEDSDE